MTRTDERKADQLRPIEIIKDYIKYPEGSVLFSLGETKVLCNASVESGVPRWLEDDQEERGWITGEYSMLPRATLTRSKRETTGLKGRTQEIKRLIGRSLRQAVDLTELGNRTVVIDCDVLQADGGTRTASITGGYLALRIALDKLIADGSVPKSVLKTPIAAVSVGIIDNLPLLDLCYTEDATADMDLNVVMNSNGSIVEIQGTSEGTPCPRPKLDLVLNLAEKGINELLQRQAEMFETV